MAKINGFRVELEEVEARISASHPAVNHAVCVIANNSNITSGSEQAKINAQKLCAFLTLKTNFTVSRDDLDRVMASQQMYEDHYTEHKGEFDGWISSYNSLPYPLSAMQEWAGEVSQRIVSHLTSESIVVEVGCGSGIILARIIQHCAKYIGTDFSASAIKSLSARVDSEAKFSAVKDKIELHEYLAHQLEFLPSQSVDMVILNSVVQYFPSASYLTRCLTEADRVLKPGMISF
jgi:pristinamycin I synthase-3/4